MNYYVIILAAVITFETGLLVTILWRFVSSVKSLAESVSKIEKNIIEQNVTCRFAHSDIDKDLARHEMQLKEHDRLINEHEFKIKNLE